MSVSAAATALYKSLPWQPAAPCLSSVISPPPGDAHSLWQAFALSVYKSCYVAFLAWMYRDKIWFIDLLRDDVFLVNISFAWKDCLLHFVKKKNGTAPCVAVSEQGQVLVLSWPEEEGCSVPYWLIWNSVIRSENSLRLEVSSRAPLGITQAVPSCCFVFFLYPFNTSTALLKLVVRGKNNNLSSLVSVWIRPPLHFSGLNWSFLLFTPLDNPSQFNMFVSDIECLVTCWWIFKKNSKIS